jgi:integrase
MAKINVKSAYKVRSKGRDYYYAWKGRGAPRLYSEPGSDAFIRELSEALEARKVGDKSKMSALITQYRASDEFAALADTTKRNWLRWLDRIRDKFGSLSIRQFDRPGIRVDIRKWHKSRRAHPRDADYGLQVLSALLSFAVTEGKLSANPCIGIPTLYSSNRADIIWTEADLEKLRERASPEIYQAARLALLTGLRQSDLLKLKWAQVSDLLIERETDKGKRHRRRALIPMYDELREFLGSLPRRGETVLTNSRGEPWKGFGSSWNKALYEAGLHDSDLHFHDLRGTAATRMYVAGLTIREIAQFLAWSEDRVERLIERYVKRDEIMRDRIRRINASRDSQA